MADEGSQVQTSTPGVADDTASTAQNVTPGSATDTLSMGLDTPGVTEDTPGVVTDDESEDEPEAKATPSRAKKKKEGATCRCCGGLITGKCCCNADAGGWVGEWVHVCKEVCVCERESECIDMCMCMM